MTDAQATEIRFACQTYSWQMSGRRYHDRIDHIAKVVASAGFQGLEIDTYMLGRRYRGAGALASLTDASGLELAALAHGARWNDSSESDTEREDADRIIELLGDFPDAKLVLVQLPGADRTDLRERQRAAISCMNAVGRRAIDAGLRPSVHPNSPPGSLFRVAGDYEVLLEGLDPDIGFTPDVGHIAAGGMDPIEVVRAYWPRVDHVHFKDVAQDGAWAPSGAGTIDFPAIVGLLAESRYRGWIVFEDESDLADRAPDEATRRSALYVREALMGIEGAD